MDTIKEARAIFLWGNCRCLICRGLRIVEFSWGLASRNFRAIAQSTRRDRRRLLPGKSTKIAPSNALTSLKLHEMALWWNT
ncbi:MAG: hypothetical protein HEQ26_22750 [Dolichospermum sp. DL01]|nr:MAG: hypothetical protein HEQ26_22750 [Dolichospermum sp. DL01]